MSNHSEHSIQIVEVGDLAIKLVGNPTVLQQPLLGLFCSQKCPGELILKAYEVAKQLREQRRVVVSGFHSPVEKDLLSILLRGNQPVVICLARDVASYRIPKIHKAFVDQGRLVLLSPVFKQSQKRITQDTAEVRNSLIAQICSQVLVIHAEPGGEVERVCEMCQSMQREVFALPGRHNDFLFSKSVMPWSGFDVVR